MHWQIVKIWLRIKLRQITTQGGIAVGILWLSRLLGYEIPPEYMPSLETIGLGLVTLLLLLLRESGETDALQKALHQVTLSHPDLDPTGLLHQPQVSDQARRDPASTLPEPDQHE